MCQSWFLVSSNSMFTGQKGSDKRLLSPAIRQARYPEHPQIEVINMLKKYLLSALLRWHEIEKKNPQRPKPEGKQKSLLVRKTSFPLGQTLESWLLPRGLCGTQGAGGTHSGAELPDLSQVSLWPRTQPSGKASVVRSQKARMRNKFALQNSTTGKVVFLRLGAV